MRVPRLVLMRVSGQGHRPREETQRYQEGEEDAEVSQVELSSVFSLSDIPGQRNSDPPSGPWPHFSRHPAGPPRINLPPCL